MATRRLQHSKGKARPRRWHRSTASSKRYARLVEEAERMFARAEQAARPPAGDDREAA